jgi:hypothetical protein
MRHRWIVAASTAGVVLVIAMVVLDSVIGDVDWTRRLDPNGDRVDKSFTQPIEPVKRLWPELPTLNGPMLTMGDVGGDEVRLPADANSYVVATDSTESHLGIWKDHPDADISVRIRSRVLAFEPRFDLYLLLNDHASEDRFDSLSDRVEEYETQTDEAKFIRAIKSTYSGFKADPDDYVKTGIAYRGLAYRAVETLDDGIEAYLYVEDDVRVYSFGPSERRHTWLMVVFRASGEYVGEVIVWEEEYYELALAMARTMRRTRK